LRNLLGDFSEAETAGSSQSPALSFTLGCWNPVYGAGIVSLKLPRSHQAFNAEIHCPAGRFFLCYKANNRLLKTAQITFLIPVECNETIKSTGLKISDGFAI
jgi:hypothetical protein